MKSNYTPIWVILAAAAIIGIVTLNVQQTYAPRTCGGCVEFKKMTHEFEKNVINLIGDPDQGPQPHLRELLNAYDQKVLQLFFIDPWLDQVRILLESYESDVATLLDLYFDGELQQHDVIKQFRQLTHTLRTEVLELAHEGFRDH